MALGDGIRYNIASIDPTERAMLRDALIELNQRFFPGRRDDTPLRGGVSWWFKQDEIHQATHVHGGPEFLPWHREITNRLEAMLRQINPKLSLHYWDWTQNPTSIPNANLGGGTTGALDLFTSDFMGEKNGLIGEPWLHAGYYVPGALNFRSTNPFDPVNKNPADPPREVTRVVAGPGTGPESVTNDNMILSTSDYAAMRVALEQAHNRAHGFVNMGSQHTSFRDPFVFLLHSNVDRLFARWQTDPAHPERLDPNAVYGSETADAGLNSNIRPWSGAPPTTRPWAPPENLQESKNYKHPSVVAPPRYDTNLRPDWSGINDNWRAIGGFFPVGARVSALARYPNHLDLFVVGNDGRVYTSWYHEGGDWSGINDNWRGIGGFFPVGAAVSALARYPNHLDLFVVGNDGRVYTSWYHEGGDWSGINDNWRGIGGFFPVGAAVSALARYPNHLDLFVVGNDGRVYTSWYHEGGDWSGINDNWRGIGGFFPVGTRVTALARYPNHLDLFVMGNDGRVYTSWYHEGGDWSGTNDNWRAIGGFFPAGARVSAVARYPNHLDLFVVGNDGRVYTSWYHEGSDWSGLNDNWRAIGGFFPAGTPVSALARYPNHLDLFVMGNDGRVYTSWWHEG